MQVSIRNHETGFAIYTVSTAKSVFELSSFGGQLLSWTHGGVPILFSNSDHAALDGKAPYRGGAPICFPYFGKGALLPSETPLAPQHGRARNSIWDVEVVEAESAIVLRTTQPAPDGFGPSSLSCELTYSFSDGLGIAAQVANLGDNPSPFQIAIHCYWACADPTLARIRGIGNRYIDNLNNLKDTLDPDPSGAHVAPFDRAYPDAGTAIELETDRFQIQISTHNCAGAVIWNPGVDHGLSDLGSPDFICLESGAITPAPVLKPGEEYRLEVEYRVRQSEA